MIGNVVLLSLASLKAFSPTYILPPTETPVLIPPVLTAFLFIVDILLVSVFFVAEKFILIS